MPDLSHITFSRRREDSFIIGDPAAPLAKIMLIDIRGPKAFLRISAPRELPVMRSEIAQKYAREIDPLPPGPAILDLIARRDELENELQAVRAMIEKREAGLRRGAA